MTGGSYSADFPVTAGVIQTQSYGDNAFITKFKADGSGLVYSTLLGGGRNGTGGSGRDGGTAIAVDSQGNAFIAGMTGSLDFPVTQGAFETENLSLENSGNSGSFVSKINSTATVLLYSTYLGGTGDQSAEDGDSVKGLALDAAGNIYVAGVSVSVDFPTTMGVFQPPTTGQGDMFLTKFNGAEMTTLPISTVAVTSNANPQEYGQPLTFAAAVTGLSGVTPTGTVAFSIYGFQVADCLGTCMGMGPWNVVPLSGSGVASLTPAQGSIWAISGLPIAVYYLGDSNNAPALGVLYQTVTAIPTVTTLTANPSTITWGQSVVFTAKVADKTGKPVPGSVGLDLNGVVYAGGMLDSTGTETLSFSTSSVYPLTVGQQTINARYSESQAGHRYSVSSASVVLTVNAIGVTSAPAFSLSAGTYTSYQNVTINDSNPLAIVYYTIDGSAPVVGSSLSSAPGFTLQVVSSETIQAIAVAPGYTQSPITSAVYIINIPAPPDFSLSLAPAILTIDSGKSGSTQVSVNAINAFTQSVSLSCSGLPTGVTCGFSPSSASPAAPSTLMITASATAGTNVMRMGLPFLPCIMIAGACGLLSWRRHRVRFLVLLACFAATMSLGCGSGTGANGSGGGGSGGGGQKTPTTYQVTITGTSGSLTHSTSLTLTLN